VFRGIPREEHGDRCRQREDCGSGRFRSYEPRS
jgi:hypothetical protein